MSCLTQRLVATTLAAIFAVVGCTGEALYYLVEADFEQPVQAEDQLHESHHHHHGDGLWHHHGPPRSSTASAKAVTPPESPTSDGKPAARKQSPGHQPHTCIALALVSQIQQSVSDTTVTVLDCEQTSMCIEVSSDRLLDCWQSTLGARGPPLTRVV